MITYEETKPFRDTHADCNVEESAGTSFVRLLCVTHNKTIIAAIPPKPEECDSCEKEAKDFFQGNWLCRDCYSREKTEYNKTKEKIRAVEVLEKNEKVNTSLKIKEDIFNAETVSLVELEKAVRINNSELPESEQYYAFANKVKEQILNYKKLISQKHEEILETTSRIRAGQQHLNSIANKLRAEVREEFKIKDTAYKPEVVKVKPVKTAAPPKNKVNKQEMKLRVAKLVAEGVTIANEYLFQMQLIRFNNDMDKAEGWIRRQFKEISSDLD